MKKKWKLQREDKLYIVAIITLILLSLFFCYYAFKYPFILTGNAVLDNASGPVSHYSFNRDVYDVISGNEGIVNGSVLTQDRFGNNYSAFYFNENDYISIPNVLPSKNPDKGSFSVGIWFKADSMNSGTLWSLTEYNGASKYNNNYEIKLVNGSIMTFEEGNGRASISNLSIGEWYYVVGIFSDGINTIWINAERTASATERRISHNINTITIGATRYRDKSGGYQNFFNGTIDDVKIWARSLSEEEIKEEYIFSYSNLSEDVPDLDSEGCERWSGCYLKYHLSGENDSVSSFPLIGEKQRKCIDGAIVTYEVSTCFPEDNVVFSGNNGFMKVYGNDSALISETALNKSISYVRLRKLIPKFA